MKNIFLYSRLVLIVLASVVLFSCKKSFLEILPKGKQVAQTTADYDMLLSNLDFMNISTDAQAPMGDEIAAAEPYFAGADLRTQRLFRWEKIIYEPGQGANEMDVPMKNIYTFNKVINDVMDATGGTEQKKKSVRAEALAGRAWTYFLLINYYGKPYNETTAASDPGYPIITEADVTQTKFERSSVKDVYDLIISDLTTAIPDLPPTAYRIRMSKAAAEGLLGKVYMFMGKYNEALPLLNAAITDIANSQIPLGLYNYNETFAPGGIFMPIGMFGPSMPGTWDNKENILSKQFINYWTFVNNELVVTTETANLFGASDLRRNFYAPNAFFGDDYPNGMMRRIGPISTSYGVTIPDTYLLLAECKARLNDLAGAVTDVETLRKNRMPAPDATVPGSIASDKNKLVKFILEERIREFAVQGYRWFDMRRLSVDPDFGSTVNYTHKIYDEAGNITETFTLTPERLTLQFPKKIMDENPGMENNP